MTCRAHAWTLAVVLVGWPLTQTATHAEHVIAQGGRPGVVVALAPDASPAEALAASEVARYLGLVTKAQFRVVSGQSADSPRIVVLSQSKLGQALHVDLRWAPLPRDAYRLFSSGRDIVIAGHNGRAALFGAYYFLYKHAGCRWYMPGPLGEVLPHRPTLTVPSLDELRVPAFEYRIASGFRTPEYIDWAAKQGLQVWSPLPSWWAAGAQGERELCVRGTIHHAFDKVAPATVFGQTHPEYFGLLNSERLTAPDKVRRGQLCVTDPELAPIVAQAAGRYFGQHPSAEFFSLCPNDNQNWCACRRCRACDPTTMVRWGRTWPVVSDRYFGFVRKVAQRLAATHPGKKLYCFSYQTYTDPPLRVQLPSNVIVSVCHMVPACYAHPITDPACGKNVAFDKLVRGWAQRHDNLWYYAYTCKSMWQQMPWPIFRRIVVDIRHLRDQGFRGFYSQGSARIWGQLGINFYVMVQALWDPALDVDVVLDDYCNGFYADASEPMRRFHETLAAAFSQPGVYVHHEAYEQAPAFMTPDVVRACDAALADARGRARTDLLQKRIQPVATAWEFAKLYLGGHQAYARFEQTGKEADVRQAVEAYERIMQLATPPLNFEALSAGSARRYVEPKLERWRVALLLCSSTVQWRALPLGDGSFEHNGEGWSIRDASETRIAAIRGADATHGQRCLRLKVADDVNGLPPSDWVTNSATSDSIAVDQGELYRLSAWVRVPARLEHTHRGAIMGLLGYDAKGKRVSYTAIVKEIRQVEATDGWVRLQSGGVLVDPTVKSVRVRVGMAGRGECSFDDVRLETASAR